MCGIAGFYGTTVLNEQALSRLRLAMSNRGPDNWGMRAVRASPSKNLYLFHSKLTITDSSSESNQPFESGNGLLSFNGELYNYKEIRTKRRFPFKSNSDTEIVAKLLEADGPSDFSSWDGMWAFAWYHKLERSLTLSRDIFGEKPLYYYISTEGVYFGSEVRFIEHLISPKSLRLNRSHISKFLSLGFRSLHWSDESFYHNVFRVEPGTTVTVKNDGGIEVRTYSHLENILSNPTAENSPSVENLRQQLVHSVRSRIEGVNVGVCLSGGIDSSAIVSIAKRIENRALPCYTARFEGNLDADCRLAGELTRELKLSHSYIDIPEDNYLENIQCITAYHNAPLLAPAWYSDWFLKQKMQSDGVRIALSGTGIDELFTGYNSHFLFFFELLRKEQPDRLLHEIRSRLRNDFSGISNKELLKVVPMDYEAECRLLYTNSQTLTRILNYKRPLMQPLREFTRDPLRNRLLKELFFEIVPIILNQDDLNSMAHSIENRSPFLNRALLKMSLSTKSHMMIKDGYLKSFVRQSLRNVVPDFILFNRRKSGYNTPLLSILERNRKSMVSFMKKDSFISEFVNQGEVVRMIEENLTSYEDVKFLFNVINTKVFLDKRFNLF